jgi:hypothetical protein
MATTITKLFSTGILQSTVPFDEVTSFSSSGQAEFITTGTYSWTAPAGVTSVSVVAIGPGATNAGGGGGLTWANGLSVTPGQSYTVVVGAGGYTGSGSTSSNCSSFNWPACIALGGGSGGGTGGPGGRAQDVSGAASYGGGYGGTWGGGAGGYAGNGGVGYGSGNTSNPGANGSGGGGGGGGNQAFPNNGGGGGTGIYGQGSDGVYPGGGGSGGGTSSAGGTSSVSGLYGGGGVYGGTNKGVHGAVRIIWGSGRSFPSTNTADVPDTNSKTIKISTSNVYAALFDEVTQSTIKNLLTYTEQFDNTFWSANGIQTLVTANAIASPTNVVTADLLLNTTASNRHTLVSNPITVSERVATYTWSVHVKSYSASTYLTLYFATGYQQPDRIGINVDPSTGIINNIATAGSGTYITSTSEPKGNGWYRVSVTGNITNTALAGAGTLTGSIGITTSTTNASLVNPAYVGDGTTGFYVWGAQVEAGYLTPYQGIGATGVIVTPDFAERRTSTGTYMVSGYFDETLIDISATLIYDLDAATFSAVPTTGNKDATGAYSLTVSNAGSSITWNSANGGSFVKSNNVGTDVIYGGPNYVTGQSYSVFMAYKLSATSAGRLLNTQSEASKDWLMGAYNGNPSTFYPNYAVNLPSSGADTAWHLDFATWDTTTSTGKLYTSTSVAPAAAAYSVTNAIGGGFNQLRLFSRSAGTEVQSGNIAFVKVYNGVLTLSDIQTLYNAYKTRFGY